MCASTASEWEENIEVFGYDFKTQGNTRCCVWEAVGKGVEEGVEGAFGLLTLSWLIHVHFWLSFFIFFQIRICNNNNNNNEIKIKSKLKASSSVEITSKKKKIKFSSKL